MKDSSLIYRGFGFAAAWEIFKFVTEVLTGLSRITHQICRRLADRLRRSTYILYYAVGTTFNNYTNLAEVSHKLGSNLS